jgi:hypothetical protein
MPKGEEQPAELLRLNTSIPPADEPNRLGVLAKDIAGFPNGRRLTDDVVDIEIQALEGAVRTGELVEALAAGDGVNANDLAFGTSFPYLALPHSGSAVGDSPDGGVDAGGGGTAPNADAATARGDGARADNPRRMASGPTEPVGSSTPVLPAAAALLGVGFAGLGVLLLRRTRVQGGS